MTNRKTQTSSLVWMFSALLIAGASFTSTAHAYCIGGDTCPDADSDLDVYTICNSTVSAGGSASCSGTLSMTPAHTIDYGRIYANFYVPGSGFQSGYIPVACIGNQAYPLRHSSYWGGNMVTSSSQSRDVAMCFGSGSDNVRPGTGCGTHTMYAWSYGSGHWFEFWAQSGNDVIASGTGNDRLCGGTGNDDLNSRGGADVVDGWTGNDVVNGYDSAGDVSWGYYGNDIVTDAAAGSSDAVFGEFDTDNCVMVDEAHSGDINIRVNGGTANCVAGTCSCGTSADDSCSDLSTTPLYSPLGSTVGIEGYYSPYCPFF